MLDLTSHPSSRTTRLLEVSLRPTQKRSYGISFSRSASTVAPGGCEHGEKILGRLSSAFQVEVQDR